jgi:hypothetical protein
MLILTIRHGSQENMVGCPSLAATINLNMASLDPKQRPTKPALSPVASTDNPRAIATP